MLMQALAAQKPARGKAGAASKGRGATKARPKKKQASSEEEADSSEASEEEQDEGEEVSCSSFSHSVASRLMANHDCKGKVTLV